MYVIHIQCTLHIVCEYTLEVGIIYQFLTDSIIHIYIYTLLIIHIHIKKFNLKIWPA